MASSRIITARVLFFLFVLATLSAGCASHPAGVRQAASTDTSPAETAAAPDDGLFELEEEFTASETAPPLDPLSGYNRLMTQVNDRLYFWLLKPAAQGYSAVVPEGARLAVGRFFTNLMMPVRFVNNLLQLKPQRAGVELTRFAVNSTIGVLGFGDPAAKHFGMQPCPEDFGQTLGHYGVGGGFHIVLPLLGPSNLRDTIGLVPDFFLDPVSHLDGSEVRLAVRAYDKVNLTSLHIGEYESLKLDAIDLYTFLRDGYEQRRDKLIEE